MNGTTLNLPQEGQTFAGVGDANSVYTIKGGQLQNVGSAQSIANTDLVDKNGTTYKAGSALPTGLNDAATANSYGFKSASPYTGNLWSNTSAAQQYSGFSSLPTYNIADINTAIGKGYAFNGTPLTINQNTAGMTNANAVNQTSGEYQAPIPTTTTQATTTPQAAPQPFGSNVPALPGGAAPTWTTPTSINSSNTQSTGSNNNYQQPAGTSTVHTDMAGLNASYQQQLATAEKLGPQQQQESDLTKQIMALTTQDAGRAADQTAANTANGVDSAQATINSLQATIKQNLDAYNAAQLQDQQGQGVTTAVDQRQRDQVTRQYAITSLATSSLLAAAQGDLANAQLLANKAVVAKYDPIEAQIAAGKANLELLSKDPATTAEEKIQATAVTAILNAQAAAVEQAKTNATAVQNVAVTAASYTPNFVATPQYPTAAQALQAIQSATDPVMAQQIATQTGLTAPTVKNGTWGAPYMLGGSYVQKNDVTGEVRQAVNPPNVTSTSGTPTQQQADDVDAAILDFQNKMTQNNWKGANPDAYNYYKQQLIAHYGASAAIALDAAMAKLGIVVDTGK